MENREFLENFKINEFLSKNQSIRKINQNFLKKIFKCNAYCDSALESRNN
jgi:hypothetical protein